MSEQLSGDRKRGTKFWITFWLISVIFLAVWTVYWQIHFKGYLGFIKYAKPFVKVLPVSDKQKQELSTILDLVPKIANEREKIFLVLFQNNNELRPGGGFIGTFGIMKVQNSSVTFVDTHDSTVFDSGKESGIEPPYPMEETLSIFDWEFRDSNWSPDFSTNAEKAEFFYHLQGGQEDLDGVLAVSTNLLPSFLEITGPVSVAGYPGEYNSENAITKLQYQVEQGYIEQDIEVGQRKYIIKDLSKEIIKKAQALSLSEKKLLAEKIEQHLDEKDIMIFFKDRELQQKIENLEWDGNVEQITESQDYLMMVDANLAAYKSDQVMKRNFEYTVDFRHEKPWVNLKITYTHEGKVRDWQITDYQTYLRVYVPTNSWLYDSTSTNTMRFGLELDKKYFGTLINVPLGKSKTIEFNYDLPEEISYENYELLIQKQSGIQNTTGTVIIINKDGEEVEYEVDLDTDWSTSDTALEIVEKLDELAKK